MKVSIKTQQTNLESFKCAIAAFCSTFFVQIMHPFDLIKTRFQSHDGLKGSGNIVPEYKNLRNAFSTIYNQEGTRGFYKGFGWALFAQSGFQNLKSSVLSIKNDHGIFGYWRGLSVSLPLCFHGTIQMSVYEKFQQITRTFAKHDSYNTRPAIAGFISKFCAIMVTYPLQTLRTRIQQNQFIHMHGNPKYKNMRDIIYKLYKQEGLLSLYKGVKPSLVMNLPSNSIYFFCYEFFKRILNITRDQNEVDRRNN